MSAEPNATERKDDNPFDPKNHKLYNEYMNIRSVLDKTNVENGIDMSAADLGRTSLAAMRYLKGQELGRSNRLDPDSPMPSFHRPDAAGERVGAAWRGRPILDAQQVEDVVAFLRTLKD